MLTAVHLERFHGRFGNRVGQYAAVRSLAARCNCGFTCPSWEGDSIFPDVRAAAEAATQPDITRFRSLPFDAVPTVEATCSGGHCPRRSWAMQGYFQHQMAFDLMRRSELRRWLTVDSQWMALCPPRPFYVAAHLRRGDYLKHKGKYAVVLRTAFEKAITDRGYSLDDVVWVDEQNPGQGTTAFPSHLSFLHDFLVLLQADVIFRSNSTFSFWAAALGNAKAVYSPRVGEMTGELAEAEFETGNHCMMFSTKIHKGVRHSDMRLPD